MDFLKAEIERKKRQIESSSVMAPDKKYFKRGDLSQRQAEDYMARYAPKKDTKDVDELKRIKEQAKTKATAVTTAEFPLLPRVEVVRRLRERLEPVLLFGEEEDDACKRLRQLEMDEPEKEEGIRNDFKEAMDKVDEVYLQEVLKSQGEEDETKKTKFDVQLYESELSYEDLLDLVNDVNKGDVNVDLKLIGEFIKVMLRSWGQELNARQEEAKVTVKGKIEAGTYAQTRTYLKPLLRMLRKQTVTDDIRDSLLKMIKYALQRDYILSNEAYMEMAIGNAPWPIGVTNAGIHARPARENIFSKHVAHVLNDETQRKYIQGLKRLLTKSQHYYPTDPSRSIDFVRKDEDDSAVASTSN